MKFLKSAATYGFPFGIGMGLLWGIQYGLWYGVGSGIAAGILFGTLMATFTCKMKKRIERVEYSASKAIDEGEVIFSSCANTVDGFFPKLGWLSLTKTHLFLHKNQNNLKNIKLKSRLILFKK